MQNFGELMENYMVEMENRIREQILQEILVKREDEQRRVWLNKTELASYMGVCFRTLDKFIKENPTFPSSNIAGAVRFNCNRVDEWMEIHDEVIKSRKSRKAA
ncbi:hypothetical protein [Jeotgalibaca caeni]|uniref:hypothetical protein n=1 Tax=Jeotgalibaca caeni TaxID=3028623 RepID=UPI00237E1D31|nr:hypothetical protein [Jeotgalibaca caeni]MDE1548130.1 hypothetical protein [Jeotgalibaca caeni]